MLVIKCKKLVTVTGPVINEGVLIIDDGRIKALGDKSTPIPEGAEIVDASDKWVYPGFIDAASHIGANKEPNDFSDDVWDGIRDGADAGDPISPQLKIADSIDPFDKTVERVRTSGVTSCFVAAGPAGIIDGQGVVIKMKKAETADEMIIPGSEQMCVILGDDALMTFKRQSRSPFTRMSLADMLRETLSKAKGRAESKEPYAVADRKLDALIPAVKGEMTVRFECFRADDIAAAVGIAEEFGLKYSVVGAFEAHKITSFLEKHKTPVILETTPYGPRCQEMMRLYDIKFESAGILEKTGNLQCITSNDIGPTERLPIMAGFVTAYGLSSQGALEAITIGPARQLGLENRIGSLEAGKDADIAVFTGDALLCTSHCVMAFVEGEKIFEGA